MLKFVVRAVSDGPRAYTIHMPGLAGTAEVMERYNAFCEWFRGLDFEEVEHIFPRVYATFLPEDEKVLLETFGDVVAASPEEYKESINQLLTAIR